METLALTRVSTIGPIADVIEAAGGSLARVFHRSELPLELVTQPDRLILLSDQFRLVENAAREIGDDAFAARLSIAGGIAGLGPYGRLLLSFDSLGAAITKGYAKFASLLQAATEMDLVVREGLARWTYQITAPVTIGRQRNEILAIGYMLNILRHFAGARWTPEAIFVPGILQGRGEIEKIFGGDVMRGERTTVVFPADLLDLPNPSLRPWRETYDEIPNDREFVGVAEHMIRLGILEQSPGIDHVATRLGLSRRTFQRRLATHGVTFERLAEGVVFAQARAKLDAKQQAITDIALELGYSDPAHFSRAFRRWTGETPRHWRARQLQS
ncbi:MAG: AraC family transcriptional regulator ligand-binding domain-containing protein [Methylovirgula sp.]|uniref:AraC family transcriptional regulator n=1 Tax=Methylovirgula sp. TaxID=1978224 RepID=UPI00307613E2